MLDFEFWLIGESTVEPSRSKGRKDEISKKGRRITTELCGAHVRDRPRLTIVPSTNLGAVVGRYDGHIYHLSRNSICDTSCRGPGKAGHIPLRCCTGIYPRGKFCLMIAISLGQKTYDRWKRYNSLRMRLTPKFSRYECGGSRNND